MTSTARPMLRALAERLGVLPEYRESGTNARRITSDDTRETLVRAMGFDAETEATAADALSAIERQTAERLIPPVRVLAEAKAASATLRVRTAGPSDWRVEVLGESIERQVTEGRSRSASFVASLPRNLTAGYYDVTVAVSGSGGERTSHQRLIVAPQRCFTVEEAIGDRRAFGICANLYTLRSAGNDGVGTFTDLGELVRWSAKRGAAFVGVNPLHATRNCGHEISPYSPISRVFRNDIYLDIHAVPELEHCDEARRIMESDEYLRAVSAARASDAVRYQRIAQLRRPILRALHRVFLEEQGDGASPRARGYRKFIDSGGQSLTAFATFLADETNDGEAVAEEIDFYRYVQFELDRQLRVVADTARESGMPLGLYTDLAVASGGGGFDAWAYPTMFAKGVDLGAPPDAFSDDGQNWGMPPIVPFRLREDGYRYFVELVRSAMSHAGALRIDHAMGLLRQFWIPTGRSGKEGAYVRFPADELFAILAVESRRHGTVVIGEDLGTVPRGFASLLSRWGILSYRVMYFQRNRRGRYLPASRYSKRALVTSSTHDHPPLECFWQGHDLDLRRGVDQIPTDAAYATAVAERVKEKQWLTDRLRREGVVNHDAALDTPAGRCRAVNAFISKTDAPLVGIMLDDLAGETEPVNVPGVPCERFAAWTRKMSRPVEELMEAESVATALEGVEARKLRHGLQPRQTGRSS